MGTLLNNEDPDEMPRKGGIPPGPALFAKTTLIFRERITMLIGNYNL